MAQRPKGGRPPGRRGRGGVGPGPGYRSGGKGGGTKHGGSGGAARTHVWLAWALLVLPVLVFAGALGYVVVMS